MEKRNIKIVCFAGLRKYFGSEAIVKIEPGSSCSTIIDELVLLNPEAEEVLKSCRIAVNEKFVSLTEPINSETLFLIPPSSGG